MPKWSSSAAASSAAPPPISQDEQKDVLLLEGKKLTGHNCAAGLMRAMLYSVI
jgi:hypothetical protein